MEFYQGTTKIGERTSEPYMFTWKEVPEGIYSITAAATDNQNLRTVSSAVSVVVEKSGAAINQLPIVNISLPNKGKKYKRNDKIVIEAIASDPDGFVSKVELKSGNVTLAEMITAPFVYIWEDADTGTYLVTAIATDNLGATSISSEVELSVEGFYDPNSEILNLYPNPNNGKFEVDVCSSLPYQEKEIKIVDLSGKIIFNDVLTNPEGPKEIDLSNEVAGI